MIVREKSIPVFAASTPMSSKTASSWARMKSAAARGRGDRGRVLRRQRDERARSVHARGANAFRSA
jgi:hypothetical protein